MLDERDFDCIVVRIKHSMTQNALVGSIYHVMYDHAIQKNPHPADIRTYLKKF